MPILIESYTTQLPSDRFDIRIIEDGRLMRWSDSHEKLRPDGLSSRIGEQWSGSPERLVTRIDEEGIGYIVLADRWLELYKADAGTYANAVLTYKELMERYPVAARFDETDASLGWPITILAVIDQ